MPSPLEAFLSLHGHGSYADGHRWSTTDPDAFWRATATFCEVRWRQRGHGEVWDGAMPGRWFPGWRLNYADHCLNGPGTAVVTATGALNRATLRRKVGRVTDGWRRLGVKPGDVVAAVLPNGEACVVAALAAASLGASFIACPPEYGTDALLTRLRLVAPAVLVTVDGYPHRDRHIDRRQANADLTAGLDSLHAVVLADDNWAYRYPPADLRTYPAEFDHPLFLTFSSGTTGPPKAIVHGHGGVTLDHMKVHRLYTELTPDDRLCWLTSTGWTMWNHMLSALTVGASIYAFDGDPTWPTAHSAWQQAADAGVTVLGVSPGFAARTRLEGPPPVGRRLRRILSTGALLSASDAEWLEAVTGLPVSQVSGGTDLAGEVMGDASLLPRRHGWMNCAYLGADVHAADREGIDVPAGETGEMVLRTPMPNMPVRFWNDPDGSLYRAAYFDRWPDTWRHGDWITLDHTGAAQITGRSDATLNRNGLRLGTAELYAAVDSVPGVTGSLAVHLERGDRLILFVSGTADEAAIRSAVRSRLSPRFVPDEVRAVPSIPVTATGKKPEVAVKRALSGGPVSPEAAVLLQ